MYTKVALISVLVALSEARFGQEQVPIPAIQNSSGGKPGDAATLAGSAISTLLAAANPCDKLKKADEIVATLGDGGLAAAKGLVAAEQNFNPFVVNKPTLCSDPTLPTTAALRGITPLVDPSVEGAAAQNAASAASLKTPLDATGKSVADITAADGFTNFLTKDAAGNAGAAPAAGAGNANAGSAAKGSGSAAPAASGNSAADNADSGDACAPAVNAAPTTLATVTRAAKPTKNAGQNNNNNAGATASTSAAAGATGAAAGGAVDFGSCSPAMDFKFGRPGRKATEGTFLPTDPKVAQGQQDALNPNIITNRICDQLTNVCGANQAAKDKCAAAKVTIAALGTKDASTADAWNKAVGA